MEDILAVSDKAKVKVTTICADYFMEAPLHSTNATIAEQSLDVLNRLLETSLQLGMTDIVIPCVDQSTLDGAEAVERFVHQMSTITQVIDDNGINFSLKTDLAPKAFVELLGRLNSKRFTVNYDIRNIAALSYDPVEELDAFGSQITELHFKDLPLSSGLVIVGEGEAAFSFAKLFLPSNWVSKYQK